MSGAAATLRNAVLAQLRAALGTRVNRVWDGVATSATTPYLQLRDVTATDWGTKDRAGREVRLGVTVRDAGDDAARCHALAGEVETAIEAMMRDLPGWRVASIALVRSTMLAERDAGWAALVDYRFRMLAA